MIMTDKFKDIPIEGRIWIILRYQAKIEDYDVVYEKWHRDEIYGESIIFLNADVADLNEEQIKNIVSEKTALLREDSKMTFSQLEKYTFVNFNFEFA